MIKLPRLKDCFTYRLWRRINIYSALLLFFFATSFHSQHPAPRVILRFLPRLHGQPFSLGKNYQNPFGETFRLDKFKFYLGRVSFEGAQLLHTTHKRSGYFLIDFSDSLTTQIVLESPGESFSALGFQIGIDSTDQVRGAQTGALDPIHGMFWTWNSGYQSFKLEGSSPESGEPAHMMAYHIGGYRSPFKAIRQLRLNSSSGKGPVAGHDIPELIEIPLELDSFFTSRLQIRIRQMPAVMTIGDTARMISENFATCFTGFTIRRAYEH